MRSMLLWTIQNKIAYDKMLETGSLRANDNYLFANDHENLKNAYDWISEKMREKIGNPPDSSIHYPVWAWYQWEGKRKRPDMRTHGKWCETGTPIVLITFDIPDDKVVLSDFDMWHSPLNNWELPLTEEESDAFDRLKEVSTEDEIKKAIRNSWENVFLYNLVNEYWNPPKTTQATMWEIKKEWVKKAEFFISR